MIRSIRYLAAATLVVAGASLTPIASAASAAGTATAAGSSATQAAAVVSSVGRDWSGTYTTPTKSGTVSFRATRGILYGYIGYLTVDGVRHQGVEYWNRQYPGQRFFNWSYANGTIAMQASTSAVTTTTESGPITFYNRSGVVVDSGMVTIH